MKIIRVRMSRHAVILIVLFFIFQLPVFAAPKASHDMYFKQLATSWDEGIPLGNGMIGALIWQRKENMRFSLDRADLWDLRPMRGLHRKEFNFQWVFEQVLKKDYSPVQKFLDGPYDHEPAPSKIPGAALEFPSEQWGNVQSVQLFLETAICEVKWETGVIMKTFVHAEKPAGWFRFENVRGHFSPQLIAPHYEGEVKNIGDPVGGDDLSRLGYQQGVIEQHGNSIIYKQKGWGDFSYTVSIRWKKVGQGIFEGVWSISTHYLNQTVLESDKITLTQLRQGFYKNYSTHESWWKNFWSKSKIQIPDEKLEKQWYQEQYKFGSASRKGSPPISLQAVWTADNGRLPPWKGDYHHDLNTQLSYWPSYSANHLDEAMVYLDHLDKNKANYQRYTNLYFGKKGLAVPGVTTLDGTEMGGWIQYALSPTVSAWLSHHYYLQWRYSMDKVFLKERAYPWIKETAIFLENLTIKDELGRRKLPLSSSPEINDNNITAWFQQTTNYDLALMKFVFLKAAEMAKTLGLTKEAEHWESILGEFGDFAISKNQELMIAPSQAYQQSHRHFSNMMAIHPLGLIKWEDGEQSQMIIRNSIHLLDSIGPDYWCGYTYSWLANLKARAKDGEGAANALQIFAKAFCLANGFHANGDQTKSGYSKFEYRPFTLEGNFAFAAGLQEMLLQSYAGFIEVLPAVPVCWKDISFSKLRAEGAFLIDAVKEKGSIRYVKIVSEKGGTTVLKLPFPNWRIKFRKSVELKECKNGYLTLLCKPGAELILLNKNSE